MGADRERIEDAIRACLQARALLDGNGAFRTRVLLDMLLIELGRELARLTERPSPTS